MLDVAYCVLYMYTLHSMPQTREYTARVQSQYPTHLVFSGHSRLLATRRPQPAMFIYTRLRTKYNKYALVFHYLKEEVRCYTMCAH